MTCPWCGAPVIIRGNQWECGYCGDHGFLAPVSPPQEKGKTEEGDTGPVVMKKEIAETGK